MPGQWKEVVRLGFKGDRFRDHALDLSALTELSQFQKLIAETAKALWRTAHPDRERLPSRFEDRTRLCLRRIEPGSAVVPLEVYIEEPDSPQLWDPEPKEVNEAIGLAHEVLQAVAQDAPLPERFPRQLVSEYAKWGQSLADNEEIELRPPGKAPSRISALHRQRLAAFVETAHEDTVEVTGEVFEADVRQGKFQLWCDDGPAVAVSFDAEQEELVTTALKEHRSARLLVRGRGEFSPSGQLRRFVQVHTLEMVSQHHPEYDTEAPSIEDVLSALAAEVPEEDWDNLPTDLSDNLDHYLYGTPRQ